MSNFETGTLINALDNDNNSSILELDSSKISTIKNNILQKLQLSHDDLKDLHKKLKNYRYVDELPDINYGSYIRWINLRDPNKLKLTNGGFICDIQVNDCINITCKNQYNRFFQLKMSENIIFQKITNQEKVLLNVMDYLNK